jgi:hypothetical protein
VSLLFFHFVAPLSFELFEVFRVINLSDLSPGTDIFVSSTRKCDLDSIGSTFFGLSLHLEIALSFTISPTTKSHILLKLEFIRLEIEAAIIDFPFIANNHIFFLVFARSARIRRVCRRRVSVVFHMVFYSRPKISISSMLSIFAFIVVGLMGVRA